MRMRKRPDDPASAAVNPPGRPDGVYRDVLALASTAARRIQGEVDPGSLAERSVARLRYKRRSCIRKGAAGGVADVTCIL